MFKMLKEFSKKLEKNWKNEHWTIFCHSYEQLIR